MKNKVFAAILLIIIFPFLCGFTAVNSIEENEGEERPQSVSVMIIMYHNIRKSEHGKFCISPDEFESDLRFIKENGYNTVTVKDLINYVYDGVPLPQKAVMLTFDDGNFGVYKYAYPLLKENGMKAVMSIIGHYTDKYSDDKRTDINYPNFTWAQVSEMKDSGLIEFQNHSYNLHSGDGACACAAKGGAMYEKKLKSDLERMQNRTREMTGAAPEAFTYPFGRLSKKTERIIKEMGFRASLSCFEGVNKIRKGDKDCLYVLKRYNRPHNKPIAKFFDE